MNYEVTSSLYAPYVQIITITVGEGGGICREEKPNKGGTDWIHMRSEEWREKGVGLVF